MKVLQKWVNPEKWWQICVKWEILHFLLLLMLFHYKYWKLNFLTHWGWLMHICIGKPTTIGSDNGSSPERRQAIIWTNAGILLIGPLGTNFSEILIEIQTFSWKKIRLKMSSAKCCSFRLGLNVLMNREKKIKQFLSLTHDVLDKSAVIGHMKCRPF